MVWLWVIVGVAALLVFSILVGLALAAILGRISHEVSEMLESFGLRAAEPRRVPPPRRGGGRRVRRTRPREAAAVRRVERARRARGGAAGGVSDKRPPHVGPYSSVHLSRDRGRHRSTSGRICGTTGVVFRARGLPTGARPRRQGARAGAAREPGCRAPRRGSRTRGRALPRYLHRQATDRYHCPE